VVRGEHASCGLAEREREKAEKMPKPRNRRMDAFGALLAVVLLSMLFGILWGQSARWIVPIFAISLVAAGGLGYLFRAGMVMLLPEHASGVMKSAPLTASFGLLGVICMILLAVFADVAAPFGKREIVGDVWEPAGGAFLLGTDILGRDMFSQLIYGSQTTISVALAASVLSLLIGFLLNFTVAVMGGWVDQVLSRVHDLLLPLSTLVFVLIVVVALWQPSAHIFTLIAVIAVVDQIRVFRLSRAIAIDFVALDFVEAARLRGEGWFRIIFRDILPNMVTPLIAALGLRFVFAILLLSTLSFLGLGIQPPEADWGGMVKENREGIVFLIPAALYPGAAIAILAVCVNMVVDWLLNRNDLAI